MTDHHDPLLAPDARITRLTNRFAAILPSLTAPAHGALATLVAGVTEDAARRTRERPPQEGAARDRLGGRWQRR